MAPVSITTTSGFCFNSHSTRRIGAGARFTREARVHDIRLHTRRISDALDDRRVGVRRRIVEAEAGREDRAEKQHTGHARSVSSSQPAPLHRSPPQWLIPRERPFAAAFVSAPPHAASANSPNINFRISYTACSRQEISLKNIAAARRSLAVLKHVSFDIPQGSFVSIVGPSGSGKTTLLGLLAGLDTPSGGTVSLDGTDLTRLTEDQRALLRGEKVGFIFQTFQLIPTLTAIENVQVPLELRGESGAAERATPLLKRVGLADRMDHFPTQLSGGEQQRVAIARAFSNSPRILFADEPTGNLDGETGARIVELLEELNRESGSTIIIVTHDITLAQRAGRMIRLKDGVVVEDTTPARRA